MKAEKRKKIINKLTEDIIKLYEINIPIQNIEEVVKSVGGTIIEDDSMDEYHDAEIRKTGKETFQIVIPVMQPVKRKNFIVAQRLGSLFLNMGFQINDKLWDSLPDNVFYDEKTYDEVWGINEFAFALLMPKDTFKMVVEMNKTDFDMVKTSAIADYFNVYNRDAAYRGESLELFRKFGE